MISAYERSKPRADGRVPGKLAKADREDIARRLAPLSGAAWWAEVERLRQHYGVRLAWILSAARRGAA